MPYKDVAPPAGEKITRTDRLTVPDQPIIPFIRGDGTGPDIWAASVRVFDAAVEKAYGGRKKIARSEEHTSELQSHHDLVCRLLLEKKKKQKKRNNKKRK